MSSRSYRRVIARFAIVAMAFGQLALTAYACPVQGPVLPVATIAAQHNAAVPCADMDMGDGKANTNACAFHCTDSVTQPAQPDLPVVALAALPEPTVARVALEAPNRAARSPVAALSGAPPLNLQFCRLQI